MKRFGRAAFGESIRALLRDGAETSVQLKISGAERAVVLAVPSSCTANEDPVVWSGPAEASGGAAGAQVPLGPVTPTRTMTSFGALLSSPSLTTRIAT